MQTKPTQVVNSKKKQKQILTKTFTPSVNPTINPCTVSHLNHPDQQSAAEEKLVGILLAPLYP